MITQTLVQMAYDRGLRTRDLIKTDKGIAMLKAIVEEEGALGVGYMDAIMDKIDSYFIINATRNIATMGDRKSTRLNSSHLKLSRMPSSA